MLAALLYSFIPPLQKGTNSIEISILNAPGLESYLAKYVSALHCEKTTLGIFNGVKVDRQF